VAERNVLGAPLEPCGTDPLTGYYRDGCCSTGPEDLGRHTICAVMTTEFLEHQRSIGNDLLTPVPEYRFPGLLPGDRWCVTALNWLRAHHDGCLTGRNLLHGNACAPRQTQEHNRKNGAGRMSQVPNLPFEDRNPNALSGHVSCGRRTRRQNCW